MHLHSSVHTLGDIHNALGATVGPRGVYFDDERSGLTQARSRSHARKFTFYLIADDGYGRRYANSGHHGAGHNKAATYDEWGVFLAYLFQHDPDMKAGQYSDATDFETQTHRTISEWLALELPNYDGKVAA